MNTQPGRGRIPFSFPEVYFLASAYLILLLGTAIGGIYLIHNWQLRAALSDIFSPLVDLSVGTILLIAARNYSTHSTRNRLAWVTLALAFLFYSLGDISWFILEIAFKVKPSLSIGDIFYLAYYPIAMVGVVLLLEKPGRGEKIRIGIDISMVTVAAILGFWNFLIGPVIHNHLGETALAQSILLAYPVGDLIIFVALLLLLYNLPENKIKTPLFWIAGGLLLTVITDSLYCYQSYMGTYISGGSLDLGWIVSAIFFGAAGVSQWKVGHSKINGETAAPSYPVSTKYTTSISLLPYLWLAGAFTLLLAGGMGWIPLPMGFLPLAIGVGIIICLILVRQIYALSENKRLNTELHHYVERVQSQAVELEKANLKLERDIEERKLVEEALRDSEVHLSEALRMARMGYWEYDTILDQFTFNDQFYTLFRTTAEKEGGYGMASAHYIDRFVHPQDADFVKKEIQKANETIDPDYKTQLEHRILRTNGEMGYLSVLIRVHKNEQGRTVQTDGVCHDVTERVKSEEEIKRRLGELEAVNQVSKAIRLAPTLKEMLPLLLGTILEKLNATDGAIWLYNSANNELRQAVSKGRVMENGRSSIQPETPAMGINGYAFTSGQPYVAQDFQKDSSLSKIVRHSIPAGMGGAAIPIRAGQSVIGTIEINVSLPRELTPDEIHLLTILSEIAGNAIQRITLHQQTERRLQQLTALSNIDRVISSTADIHLSLGLLLEHVTTQLNVDATDVLLFNPALQILDYSIGRGFHSKSFEQTRLRLGEGYAGRAVLKREIVYVPDLAGVHDNPSFEKVAAEEQFVSYYGVPLIARGQVKGVLEIFQRSPLEPDKEWLDFLNSLMGQAAIAIDSNMQFESLQRSNSELRQAYDETIEGWSRALDLRDNETEGHTQRVTEMTVALARETGFSETELVQVRWGSLLHDIGKMGVPDRILLKAGPLTEEEWVVMKKHPTQAYEMISPIRYLRGAQDIPYCHHEKWDGSGYPRGLKGEQIPLAARIFAIVDVWDALCSDRPYCSAWPDEKVREYIQAGSGTHFDPYFVEVFLNSKIFKVNQKKRLAEK